MKDIPLIEPVVGREELSNVEEVLASGYMTEGPKAAAFEERFASKVGAEHGVAATSCTTALELCLRALDVGPGDEVIVPDFTHPATADVALMVGADPVLVDVDISTYNTSPELVEEAITEDTKCVMPVSLFGNPLEYDAFRDLSEDHGVPVVEDAACSAGAEYRGDRAGSAVDAACFSFHPRKVITTGEGGMVTTNDSEIADEIRAIKKFGSRRGDDGLPTFFRDGTNYKLSDVLAAIGLAQMDKMDDIVGRRKEIAARYDELLDDQEGIRVPGTLDGATHTYQTYAVYLEDDGVRSDVMQRMAGDGIQTQIGTYALHPQPVFRDAKRVGDLENSTKLYHNLLTLPICHDMTDEDQDRVVTALSDALEANR